MADDPDLSVVIPVYGCADCLAGLHRRLTNVLQELHVRYEIVFVDDRSPDRAWPVLCELAMSDPHVRAIRLSRNFGQHAAITAGLAESAGARMIVMDCDLQDPPEAIPCLLEQAELGYDVVLARRKGRRHSVFRRLTARVYFRLLRIFSGVAIDGDFGTLSLISRDVADAYLRIRDQGRHYLFILHWLGFEQTAIDVDHAERLTGKTSYTFVRLIGHAMQGMFFQSTRLLRWIVYVGFVFAIGGVGLAAYVIYVWATAKPYPGWTSLAVLLLIVGGMIITGVGVTGLYIGQIFTQVKGRPLYVVDRRVSVLEPAQDRATEAVAP